MSFGLLLVSRFIQYTRTAVVLSAIMIYGVLHGSLVFVSPLVRDMRDETQLLMFGSSCSLEVSAGRIYGSSW